MYERALKQIRSMVKAGNYVLTTHAIEEMDDDNLFLADIEKAIFTGRIIERQEDVLTLEWKYRILGQTTFNADLNVLAKVLPARNVVIITVFLE